MTEKKYWRSNPSAYLITPHAQRERGKVIGVGVHIFTHHVGIIYLWTNIIFESYFSDRLTFSNVCGRTSCRIYRLALSLLSPEMLPR